jgi:carbamoyl-phosphate synthase/aspartate carbamoyltransferase/dihydroorotase
MSLEETAEQYWVMEPGPLDVHTHPRVFDALTDDDFLTINEGTEGKAGLRAYTAAALASGITAMLAMPNESVRRYELDNPERTETVAYPIASLDRVLAMEAAISHEAVIPTGIYMGVNPETAYIDNARNVLNKALLHDEFENAEPECLALKLYLAETTGGHTVALVDAAEVISIWNFHNPDKPVTLHVEDGDVKLVLEQIARFGMSDVPIHIAHVSSREELTAVITAKGQGMNVTCEVTPHHLFLDERTRAAIGGYGCMKPSLKPRADVDFLWQNMAYIDMFASDCAPHRRSDKENDPPAFGVTNHTLMLPLLLGAYKGGNLTMQDIYHKFCIAPRQRFNLPLEDKSLLHLSTRMEWSAAHYDHAAYGFEPFTRSGRKFKYVGEVVLARGGQSEYSRQFPRERMKPSYSHLLRPKNIRLPEDI